MDLLNEHHMSIVSSIKEAKKEPSLTAKQVKAFKKAFESVFKEFERQVQALDVDMNKELGTKLIRAVSSGSGLNQSPFKVSNKILASIMYNWRIPFMRAKKDVAREIFGDVDVFVNIIWDRFKFKWQVVVAGSPEIVSQKGGIDIVDSRHNSFEKALEVAVKKIPQLKAAFKTKVTRAMEKAKTFKK